MLGFTGTGTSGWLWLGVAYVFTDCIASIKLIEPADAAAAEQGTAGSGSGGGGRLAALVDKASLRFFKFQRGELVLLKSPDDPGSKLVRRLVGLEGDWVSVPGGSSSGRHGAKVERIPKGCCWAEADSGAATAAGGDSRSSWGPVPVALIEGRVSHVLWPPAHWGALLPQPATSATRVVGKAGSLEFLSPPADNDDWWG